MGLACLDLVLRLIWQICGLFMRHELVLARHSGASTIVLHLLRPSLSEFSVKRL